METKKSHEQLSLTLIKSFLLMVGIFMFSSSLIYLIDHIRVANIDAVKADFYDERWHSRLFLSVVSLGLLGIIDILENIKSKLK
jgi:hypothetical protein